MALGIVKGLPFLPQMSLWLPKVSLFWRQKVPGKRLRTYSQANIIKKERKKKGPDELLLSGRWPITQHTFHTRILGACNVQGLSPRGGKSESDRSCPLKAQTLVGNENLCTEGSCVPQELLPPASVLSTPQQPSPLPLRDAVTCIILQIKLKSPNMRSLVSISHFKMSQKLYPPPLSFTDSPSHAVPSGPASTRCLLSSAFSGSPTPGIAWAWSTTESPPLPDLHVNVQILPCPFVPGAL